MDVESNEFLSEGLSDDKAHDQVSCDKPIPPCEATSQTQNSLKPPAPKFITEEEMQVFKVRTQILTLPFAKRSSNVIIFKNCLPRWLREIDEDIKSLKSSIKKLEQVFLLDCLVFSFIKP